jgi:tetratricopeptide (TPR) repeat protein
MKKIKFTLIFLVGAFLGILSTSNLSTVREQLGWRISNVVANVKYAVHPPEDIVFVPQGVVNSSAQSKPVTPTVTSSDAVPATVLPASAISASGISPTQTSVPVPQKINLTGFQHEYQAWNNCGPATLSMALSFWGRKGNQQPIAAFTKPNARDKNVMPYEMAAFVQEKTQLQAITRVGGEIELLKRLLAAGFPVIIEKGFELPDEGWMGHYELVTGYDDSASRFTLQDSYFGPDQVMTYDELYTNWRAFNYTYIVVFPKQRRQEIESVLGQNMDEEYNFRVAAETAALEIYALTGRDRFFAWFNRGTNLMWLQDHSGSADAYDEAFSIYGDISEEQRPWRMMWYQTGPYWAYYYTGRYEDVVNLSTQTLDAMSEPVLEESYYWRALARIALGDPKNAIEDLEKSLKYHPGFEPALMQLQQDKNTP